MIRAFLAARHQRKAQEKLARIVAETRDSFEREQFRRRRAAALKATRPFFSPPDAQVQTSRILTRYASAASPEIKEVRRAVDNLEQASPGQVPANNSNTTADSGNSFVGAA